MPFFNDIAQAPVDPILGLPQAFAADPRPYKVNLGIGVYQTAEGQPLVLTSVKKAEKCLLQKHLNKEYLPIEGDQEFLRYALSLLLGKESPLFQSNQYFAAQTVGGTSALRIAGEFLAKFVSKTIFISQPTWSNHKLIFERAGLNVGSYPYFDSHTRSLDYRGICEAIKNMPPGSVILFHGSCHNPTGLDPSFEQWKELSSLIKKHQLLPLFDIAYQGFGHGLDLDAQAVRYFIEQEHEMFVTYSFSKNFGLYGERVGFLLVTCSKPEVTVKIGSQMKILIRGNYSNPPLHGARIVSTVLKSPELSIEWKKELANMNERIQDMRKALIAALLVQNQNLNFDYMHQQIGLFSFSGLTPKQVQYLKNEKAIYIPNNGRINLAGLNTQNLSYVADAFLTAIKDY